jgi:hypothetical protein
MQSRGQQCLLMAIARKAAGRAERDKVRARAPLLPLTSAALRSASFASQMQYRHIAGAGSGSWGPWKALTLNERKHVGAVHHARQTSIGCGSPLRVVKTRRPRYSWRWPLAKGLSAMGLQYGGSKSSLG